MTRDMRSPGRGSQRPDLEVVLGTLQEFITAPTWGDSRRILEQHPELLSEEADALLDRVAQAQEVPQARQLVEQHRALLRRCDQTSVLRLDIAEHDHAIP